MGLESQNLAKTKSTRACFLACNFFYFTGQKTWASPSGLGHFCNSRPVGDGDGARHAVVGVEELERVGDVQSELEQSDGADLLRERDARTKP